MIAAWRTCSKRCTSQRRPGQTARSRARSTIINTRDTPFPERKSCTKTTCLCASLCVSVRLCVCVCLHVSLSACVSVCAFLCSLPLPLPSPLIPSHLMDPLPFTQQSKAKRSDKAKRQSKLQLPFFGSRQHLPDWESGRQGVNFGCRPHNFCAGLATKEENKKTHHKQILAFLCFVVCLSPAHTPQPNSPPPPLLSSPFPSPLPSPLSLFTSSSNGNAGKHTSCARRCP